MALALLLLQHRWESLWFTFCVESLRVSLLNISHYSSLMPKSSSCYAFTLPATAPLPMALYLGAVWSAYISTGYISFFLFNILQDSKGLLGAFEARQEIMQEV